MQAQATYGRNTLLSVGCVPHTDTELARCVMHRTYI